MGMTVVGEDFWIIEIDHDDGTDPTYIGPFPDIMAADDWAAARKEQRWTAINVVPPSALRE